MYCVVHYSRCFWRGGCKKEPLYGMSPSVYQSVVPMLMCIIFLNIHTAYRTTFPWRPVPMWAGKPYCAYRCQNHLHFLLTSPQIVRFIQCCNYWNSQCYLHCVSKKPDTWDIFKYLQQTWTNINNFWYRESSINMLRLMPTILQYVVKQRTSLGFPLATRAEAGAP